MNSRKEIKTKIKDSNFYEEQSFQLYNIIKLYDSYTQNKSKLINGVWGKSEEIETIVSCYEVVA